MINNEIKVYNKDGSELIGSLTQVVSCEAEEERNGLFEVVLTSPLTEPLFFSLAKENIIVCKPNDMQELQAFRIYNVGKFMNSMSIVYARHISFDLAGDLVDKVSLVNASCEYALNSIFRQSQYCKHYRGYSDIINAQDYNMELSNCLEAIAGKEGSIIDTYGNGAEILRDNTNIHVLNRRGNDNGVTIEYGKNMTGFEFIEDVGGLTTVIKPYCTIRSEDGTESILRGELVWADNWAIFSHPYITPIDYSDKFAEGETPTKEKLKKFAEQEFLVNKIHIPNANYKIEFIALSKCVGYEDIEDRISICDTVTIKDHRYGINTKAKVIKYKYDVLTQKYITMEIGEPRTTLGDIITAKDGQDGKDGQNGKDGKDGQDGKPADVEDMPDTLPEIPVLTPKVFGMGSVELNWTFENKLYYTYELYASKTKDFTPNIFDLVHAGQSSSFMFKALPNETWYFKVCAANSHNRRTGFSNQVEVSLPKIEDLNNYFSEIAIGHAVAQSITADYMEAGIFKGHWIDARNLSVTDSNGKRTFDIDSFGRLTMMPTVFKLLIDGQEHDIVTEAQLIATKEDFQFKFTRSGSENILKNSWFDAGDLHWIPESWNGGDTSSDPNYNVSVVQGGDSQQPNWVPKGQNVLRVLNFGVHPNSNGHWCGAYQVVNVEPGQTYTFSFYCAQHRVSSVIIEAKRGDGYGGAFASKEIKGIDIRGSKESNPSFEDDFSLITFTFRVPSDVPAVRLLIWSAGKTEGSASNLWIARTQLEAGFEPTSRRKNSYEVYSNTTIIDGDGITIKHDNGSQSRFNHEAIEFLNSQGRRTLRVKDGGLNFHTYGEPPEMVGFIKSSYSGGTSYNGVTLSTYAYGDYIGIGVSDTMDENGWSSVPFITCIPHGNVPTYPQGRGVHFANAPVFMRAALNIESVVDFKSNGSVPHRIANGNSNTFLIGGDNEINVGIRYGETFKYGIKLVENEGQANKTYIDSYGDWNFQNYNMWNMRLTSRMEPQSSYLKARAKDINDSYGVMSMTEDELRYTCRHPEHITEKSLVVELPQIMSENIELDYHVNISKLSWGDYRIINKNTYYFEIETNVDDFSFTYEVVAKKIEKPYVNASIASYQYSCKEEAVECKGSDSVNILK